MEMPFTSEGDDRLIGRNRAFCDAIAYARKAARCDCSVLITGETGTGKDRVARLIHTSSRRAPGPFVTVNCAALPDSLIESELFGYHRGAFTGASRNYDGKFVAAHGGTLFLDELGDLPLTTQAKLLRAIESKEVTPLGCNRAQPVDIRVVAATHQPLEELVRLRRFREDLYFRLNVARVSLPPLRERKEDILEIAAHYLREFRAHSDASVGWFDALAMQKLINHAWPGNIRELRNVIEAIYIDPPAGPISLRSLPPYLHGLRDRLDAEAPAGDERLQILEMLAQTHWNKSDAARNLKWSRVTLYRKMAKYHIPHAAHADGDSAQPARSSAPGPVGDAGASTIGPNVTS